MPNIFSFSVQGTHCAACEIVIERELKTLPYVVSVRASASDNVVEIVMEEGRVMTAEHGSVALRAHGYTLIPHKSSEIQFSWERFLLAAVAVLFLWYIFSVTGLLHVVSVDVSQKGLFAVFGIGLVAAFSSCTAVVSGLLIAISSRAAAQSPLKTFAQKLRPHIQFNIGRILGFIGFGACVGWIGGTLQLSSFANGLLIFVIALFMIGVGIDLLHILPSRFAIRPPKWLSHHIHAFSESKNPFAPALLGALTFFLPCGFTQSMQLYALSTGSPIQAAMIMGVFTLGTLPALLGLGALTSALRGKALQTMTFWVGVFVVVLGIFNIGSAATLLGFQGFSSFSTSIPVTTALVDGKQLLTMEVTGFGYAPNVLYAQKNIPVSWQIYGGDQLGCASTLVLPAFHVQAVIHSGENVVEFTPTQSGTFPFSCSMGMVKGTLIVSE